MPRIRVLQTSDLQMCPDRPETLGILDQILATARERAADMVVIAGDLIDRDADPATMAPLIRDAVEKAAKDIKDAEKEGKDVKEIKDFMGNQRLMSEINALCRYFLSFGESFLNELFMSFLFLPLFVPLFLPMFYLWFYLCLCLGGPPSPASGQVARCDPSRCG